MKYKNIKPNQILTTRDFPVHNEQILRIYFRICKLGYPRLLPPTPVIHISKGTYDKRLSKYFKENKNVKYILVDGSHKTTALDLTHNQIHTAVFENNKDIKTFRDLIKKGEVFSLASKNTIKGILVDKLEHFSKAKFFETIEDKTKRMIKTKIIPKYMINFYKKK